ncbi:MarR family winged helix-turn-helix transcriptional regulator [Olivibacter sitiensis]|uniref:MarR family winged helix-turn-helix transcriptional regulator n=1 Tax=Olivibacter sitiensis TaxID=376470 RepID=UPI00146F985E|nr:MarR family transcriptional regulator [Olivibacter sitiensis]
MAQKTNQYLSSQGIDIRVEQLPVLLSIPEFGMTQQEIADEVGRDKSSVLRTITSLEKDGLVVVEPNKEDKRKNCVSLTILGKSLVENIRDKMVNLDKIIFANMRAVDRDRFIQFLKNIGDNLQNVHII